jgi:DNA polymerase/3'-5' exonuclease PolX
MNLAVAREIADALAERIVDAGAASRVEVAGSVRRGVPTPKDLELVCIPRYETRPAALAQPDMFDPAPDVEINMLDLLVELWLADGTAKPRLSKIGVPALGEKYKRLTIDAQPLIGRPLVIGLDLFAVTGGAQWGLDFLIRTGSAEFSQAILTRWKAIQGIGPEQRGSIDACLVDRDGQRVETPDEEAVFAACQMRYVPPPDRTDAGAVRRAAL